MWEEDELYSAMESLAMVGKTTSRKAEVVKSHGLGLEKGEITPSTLWVGVGVGVENCRKQ